MGRVAIALLIAWLPALAWAQSPHERDLIRHRDDVIVVPPQPGTIVPRAQRTSTGPIVYGYLPYWVSQSLTDIRWELLTHVAWFGGECTADGHMDDVGGWPRTDLVNAAHGAGTKVIYVFPCFGASRLSGILNDSAARQNAITDVIAAATAGDADGVDIDWEGLGDGDTAAFTSFLSELRAGLDEVDPALELNVAMPPVNWSDRYDLAAIADLVDVMFIMGYGYHWSSSDPGPVAPVASGDIWPPWNAARSVDDYIADAGSDHAAQIVLGVPYYGYDWPSASDAIPGTATANATARTYTQAQQLVQAGTPGWDENSSTPYFMYEDSGGMRQLWFEDSASVQAKFQAALDRDIGGVGMWALNYDAGTDDLWSVVEALTDTGGNSHGGGNGPNASGSEPAGCACNVGTQGRLQGLPLALLLLLAVTTGYRRFRR